MSHQADNAIHNGPVDHPDGVLQSGTTRWRVMAIVCRDSHKGWREAAASGGAQCLRFVVPDLDLALECFAGNMQAPGRLGLVAADAFQHA